MPTEASAGGLNDVGKNGAHVTVGVSSSLHSDVVSDAATEDDADSACTVT